MGQQQAVGYIPITNQKSGAILKMYGPDAAGAIDTSEFLPQGDAPEIKEDVGWLKGGWLVSPWLGKKEYAGWLRGFWLESAWLQEEAYLPVYGHDHEFGFWTYGSRSFLGSLVDTSSLNTTDFFLNNRPRRINEVSFAAKRSGSQAVITIDDDWKFDIPTVPAKPKFIGKVTSGGNPDNNAIIFAEGTGTYWGSNRVALSDIYGDYELGVPSGWSGTLTAITSNNPVQFTYNNITSDTTRNFGLAGNIAPLIDITGTVQDSDGNTLANVPVVAIGSQTNATKTASNGTYTLKVDMGFDGEIFPIHDFYWFTPVRRRLEDISNDQANQDFTLVYLY